MSPRLRPLLTVALALSLATLARAQCNPTEVKKLLATDGSSGDSFGTCIAYDGNIALIGAPGDDTFSGAEAGSAYVYEFKGGVWKQSAHLVASSGPNGYLGSSVAASDGLALLGAPGNDTALGTDAGSAYVFKRNANGTWAPAATLTDPDGAVDDWFGGAVALAGDTILVGAYGDDTTAGKDAGSVCVFENDGNGWVPKSKLFALDGVTKQFFGTALAFDGTTAVVGTDGGVAYVCVRNNGVWTQEAKLSVGGAGSSFGSRVALSGDTVVVGALGQNTEKGLYAGAAYIFARTGNSWKLQQKLLASDGGEYNFFGRAVAVSGETVIVGAPGWELRGIAQVGAVYAFTRADGVWTEQSRFSGSDSDKNDSFGIAAAMKGGRAVIGADMVDNFRGAAYVFDLHCSGPCPADCDGSGELDIDDFICFQTLFAQGSFKADCNGDQFIDIDDFICFQTAFGAGCG